MKVKIVFIMLTVLLMCNTGRSISYIRILGGGGISSSESIDIGSGSVMNYRLSTQFLFPVTSEINLGTDLGYLHLLKSQFTGRNKSYDYLNSLFMADFRITDWFRVQGGIGPYFSVGNDRGNDLGVFIAPGFEIKITDSFSIPIYIRTDLIVAEPFIFPIQILTGFTFTL